MRWSDQERGRAFGPVALVLCLAGVVLAVVVGVLALLEPRDWTMRDAGNTLLASEVVAAGVGLLAWRSGFGQAAVVIAGVLAVGALVALR
jgi:hypothetical protein